MLAEYILNINFYGVLEDITESPGKRADLFELSEIRKSEIKLNGKVLYCMTQHRRTAPGAKAQRNCPFVFKA